MKVAFTAVSDISLDDAKALVEEQYPEIKKGLAAVKSLADLEAFLVDNDRVLFIDYDVEREYARFAEMEEKVARESDMSIDDCEIVPPAFEEDDLEDYCEPEPNPFDNIPQVDVAAIEQQIRDLIREKDGGLSEGKPLDELEGPIGDMVECLGAMEQIKEDMKVLVEREQLVRESLVSVEEAWYHYRALGAYYRTKQDTLDGLIDQFTAPRREMNEIVSKLTAGVPEEQEAELSARLSDLSAEYEAKKSGIWSDAIQNVTDGDESTRRAALTTELNQLASGSTSLSAFSSNARLEETPSGDFRVKIGYELNDPALIFTGMDTSFAESGGPVTIESPEDEPSGALYDSLYNVWGDPEEFFTLAERGLTENESNVDPELGDAEVDMDGNFIANLGTFKDFYSNFPQKHEAKVLQVKENVIEPALSVSADGLRSLAEREVQLQLAFGGIFETLPEDSADLKTAIDRVRDSAASAIARLDLVEDAYAHACEKHAEALQAIEDKKQEFKEVPCVKNADTEEEGCGGEGGDPLGLKMGEEDPNAPNFTKYCYWLKFGLMATLAGLIPVPGAGGFKYWPVGLTIPSPGGLIKIPLPVIWIPLACIVLPVGVFVIFIGLCGICPSPFVLFMGTDGEKKFLISMRPTQQFGSDASDGTLKPITQGGLAVPFPAKLLASGGSAPGFGIDIPEFNPLGADSSSGVLDDVRDKVFKKINKLPDPDISDILNLDESAGLPEKRAALKSTVSKWVSKAKIPDLKFPKDSTKTNPTKLPALQVLDQLKLNADLGLPEIAVPELSNIDVTAKLKDQVDKVNLQDVNIPDIAVPAVPTIPEKEAFFGKVRDAMKKVMDKAGPALTVSALGIVPVAPISVEFINPYVCCRQTSGGIQLPPIPGAVTAAIQLVTQLASAAVIGLSNDTIESMVDQQIGNTGAPSIGGTQIKDMLALNLNTMIPPVTVPDPSNLSITDMLKSSAIMMSVMQIPGIPSLTAPINPGVTIPGSVISGALSEGVAGVVDVVDIASLPDFSTLSPVDVKQLTIGFLEDSFQQVEGTIGPFVGIINALGSSKDMTFGQMLGLSFPNADTEMVQVVTPQALAAAQAALQVLAFVPFPAVLLLSPVFKQLHPILSQDDIPPWERLSLTNFMFVAFLDEWCEQGKKGGGLFENP